MNKKQLIEEIREIERKVEELKKSRPIHSPKVSMALLFPNIPILDSLVDSLREPIEKFGGEFKVKLTEMNKEERQAFLAMEEEGWKGE